MAQDRNNGPLAGCRPLVTGAARGIGRAFIGQFLADGAARVYTGARSESALAELAAIDDRIVPLRLDVTDAASIAAAAIAAPDIDILVNNAGVEHEQSFLAAPSLDLAQDEMAVNYFGPLAMARAFAPQLRRCRGAIVNILSVAALANVPRVGTYSASKAAARSLTQGLRSELAPDGVRVLAIYAGGYDTMMSDESRRLGATLYPPAMLTRAVSDALAGGGAVDVFPDPTARHIERLARDDPDALIALLCPVVSAAAG